MAFGEAGQRWLVQLKPQPLGGLRQAIAVRIRTAVAGILLAPVSVAAGEQGVHIQKQACPFEGCTFGTWQVQSVTAVCDAPGASAKVLGSLKAGTTVEVVTGEIHLVPGQARAISTPHQSAAGLDPDAPIEILDYIGEGYSRVRQGEEIAEVKIARTTKRCTEDPNWRYCWVEVLREPVSEWWVMLAPASAYPGGWVRMSEGGLRAKDALSRLPCNKPMKRTLNSAVQMTAVPFWHQPS